MIKLATEGFTALKLRIFPFYYGMIEIWVILL